ncbi:MAG: peptide-methionine (R)-S-oxide reductase MsrB [Balneolaceae bacterium]
MKFTPFILFSFLSFAFTIACTSQNTTEPMNAEQHHHFLEQINYQQAMEDTNSNDKIIRTEEEWKELLKSDEYRILRKKGTEIPWANEYNSLYDEGVYICRACGNALFHSDTKYNSKSGWPSYWAPIKEDAVAEREDNSLFMTRTEIICNRCESHLGHVFDDGPEPTGLCYCMNSKAMKFIPKDNAES